MIPLKEAQGVLEEGEMALLYSLGESNVSLVALSRTSVHGHRIDVRSSDLGSLIRRLRSSIESFPTPVADDAARQLYRILLGPVDQQLANTTRLCIVPDQELYSLPFQVLIQPDGRRLVEAHTLFTVPSLSTLAALRAGGQGERRDLLVLADPAAQPVEQAAWSLAPLRRAPAPLPEAKEEARAIAGMYEPHAQMLLGGEATEAAFKAQAQGFDVIHLASHGYLDDAAPLYSSMALAGDEGGEDGFLEAREVMQLELDADLVILSGCETARGQITQGEGVHGLLRGFFIAGVPSVVASLWAVEDRSTSTLMVEFHRHLRAGSDVAEALARAQRFMLNQPGMNHPFQWAAFSVYGDPR